MLRSLENDGGPEALPAYHGGRRMSTTSLSSSHLKKVSKQSARKTKTYGDGTYGGSVQSKDSAGSDSGFGKKKKRRKSRKSVNAVGPAMGRRRSHGVSGKKGRGKKNKKLIPFSPSTTPPHLFSARYPGDRIKHIGGCWKAAMLGCWIGSASYALEFL